MTSRQHHQQQGARLPLRSGCAFPAVVDGRTIAVFSFYSFDGRGVSPRLIRTLTDIGGELGRYVGSRRDELEPASLTRRELEVLRLAADGNSIPAIAERLSVAPSTIQTHFKHIYLKLDVGDRAAAVARALRAGIIQ